MDAGELPYAGPVFRQDSEAEDLFGPEANDDVEGVLAIDQLGFEVRAGFRMIAQPDQAVVILTGGRGGGNTTAAGAARQTAAGR